MTDSDVPLEQCDVVDKDRLAKYRGMRAKWWRWLRTDKYHALWPQIYSMLLGDLTFRTIAAAAEADRESALYCPILMRGLVEGYAGMQSLAIRRLVDRTRKVMSLAKLVQEMHTNRGLITRENFVAGFGVAYDPGTAIHEFWGAKPPTAAWAPSVGPAAFVPSSLAHVSFDQLSGTASPELRKRDDRISNHVFENIERWLSATEIEDIEAWCDMRVAHSADQASHQDRDLGALAPTMEKIAAAHRQIVRAAEALSAHILRGPIHGSLIPVFQYSQFAGFERLASRAAIEAAQQCWSELATQRDNWTAGLSEALVAP